MFYCINIGSCGDKGLACFNGGKCDESTSTCSCLAGFGGADCRASKYIEKYDYIECFDQINCLILF